MGLKTEQSVYARYVSDNIVLSAAPHMFEGHIHTAHGHKTSSETEDENERHTERKGIIISFFCSVFM